MIELRVHAQASGIFFFSFWLRGLYQHDWVKALSFMACYFIRTNNFDNIIEEF